MDINGCQVVSEPSDKTKEGFSSTVHRGGQVRGPFPTIGEAVKCAQEWSQEPEPPKPSGEPVKKRPLNPTKTE